MKRESRVGAYLAIGVGVGAAMSSAIGGSEWIGIGMVLGVAIGVAHDKKINSGKRDDEE